MDGAEPIRIAGIEVPPEQRTPLVEALLRVIAQLQAEIDRLRAEIARLKGLPPRPTIRPSTLNASHPDPAHKKRRRGKRPGSEKRHKTAELTIHETIPLTIGGLPEGARQDGHEDFVVQDLRIEAHNICYQRIRYRLPDGSYATASLPADVQGHFGPTVRSYVLYQHYQNHVTQPLIREELLDLGIDISAGQINRLLTGGHEPFHVEKEGLLPAGREVSAYFQADDTGARHRGKNAYTTVIANPFFASFTTTESKSRVNFLELLAAPHEEYVVGEDALLYMDFQDLPQAALRRVEAAVRKAERIVAGEAAWERQLTRWDIRGDEPRRTGFADLNEALRRIHEKRDDLLLVLDHPEIPLHNNLSESDIREWAKKRKISAGTRSELGRRCRDTFISPKKTCQKLGVSFWRYLQDRIRGLHDILSLPNLIRQAVQEARSPVAT